MINKSANIIGWIAFGILICFLLMSTGAYIKDNYFIEEQEIIEEDTSAQYIYNRTILSWDNVSFWMNYFKIKHPYIVKAQIIQECGWNLDSKKAIHNGNILGLTKAENRLTTADYIEDGHCGYSSFIRCLKDYSLYQEANYTEGDYYSFLSKAHYATDTNYVKCLKQIVYKLKKNEK